MSWESTIKGFKAWLQLEKSLSPNSVAAYVRDVRKLELFIASDHDALAPKKIEQAQLEAFVVWLSENHTSERSQARTISGIRSFFSYLLIENERDTDPTELLEGPKLTRVSSPPSP